MENHTGEILHSVFVHIIYNMYEQRSGYAVFRYRKYICAGDLVMEGNTLHVQLYTLCACSLGGEVGAPGD